MELKIVNVHNEEKGKKKLPKQFEGVVRDDLIARAVISLQANSKQPYGASPEAGKRSSSILSKRRRKYRGTYGIGQSRTPRKVLTRRGTRMFFVGAFAPQTVGGRRAHPPKADKILEKKINKKENRAAIRSAVAATMYRDVVQERGHVVPEGYPFLIDQSFEAIEKTKDVKKALEAVGFKKDLERSAKKKVRAGKGKNRGRKYKKRKGVLFVVGEKCKLEKAARNIPGIDIIQVKNVNAELLAPGAVAGRATLFTEAAIEKMEKEKLFM